jgi:hypothetical protein
MNAPMVLMQLLLLQAMSLPVPSAGRSSWQWSSIAPGVHAVVGGTEYTVLRATLFTDPEATTPFGLVIIDDHGPLPLMHAVSFTPLGGGRYLADAHGAKGCGQLTLILEHVDDVNGRPLIHLRGEGTMAPAERLAGRGPEAHLRGGEDMVRFDAWLVRTDPPPVFTPFCGSEE